MSKAKKNADLLCYGLSSALIIWVSFFSWAANYHLFIKLLTTGLLLWMVSSLISDKSKKRHLIASPHDQFLWLYFILVTSVFLFFRNTPAAESCYINYILPIPVLYYGFKFCFASKSPGLLEKVFALLSLCATLVAIISILERFFQKNIIYEYFFTNVYYKYYLLAQRSMSTQQVPLVLTTFLTACSPLCLYLALKDRIKSKRIFWIFCFILICAGNFFAMARSTLFIAIALFVFGIFLLRIPRKTYLRVFFISGSAIFVTLWILRVACPMMPRNQRSADSRKQAQGCEYTVLDADQGQTESPAGILRDNLCLAVRRIFRIKVLSVFDEYAVRHERYIVALKMFKEHPFAGAGLGQYTLDYDKYTDHEINYYARTPENIYLRILAESGGISFASFIIFFVLLIWAGTKRILHNRRDSQAPAALLMSILSILGFMAFYDALYWISPFLLLWFFSGALAAFISE